MRYTNITDTEIADVLDVAVENLERCAWGQGTHRNVFKQICAQDAIWMALVKTTTVAEHWGSTKSVGSGFVYMSADDIEGAVRRHLGLSSPLSSWNDRPERTKDEVIEAFKATAKDLRNEASPA